MLITSVDENGNLFAKFEVTEEDIRARMEHSDDVIHGHEEAVRFIEALGGLENRGDAIDKIEQLCNGLIARGYWHGVAATKKKVLQALS